MWTDLSDDTRAFINLNEVEKNYTKGVNGTQLVPNKIMHILFMLNLAFQTLSHLKNS